MRSRFTDEAYQLYRKYQIAVHKDKPDKLTEHSFTNFLVTSPVVFEPPSAATPPTGYGSFHQVSATVCRVCVLLVLRVVCERVRASVWVGVPSLLSIHRARSTG